MTTIYSIELKDRLLSKEITIHFQDVKEHQEFLKFIPSLSKSFDLRIFKTEV